MEVAEDFVASPAADDFDDVDVDAAEEKCHRAASTQASCGDLCLCQANCFPNVLDRCLESSGDVSCSERSPLLCDLARAEWRCAGGAVAT